jgi:membrane protein
MVAPLFIMFGLSIALSILGLIGLAAIVYGNRIGNIAGRHLGAPAHFAFLCRSIHWLVIVILLLFSFAVLYRFGPNLNDRRWQWSIPGAVVAVTLWVPSLHELPTLGWKF